MADAQETIRKLREARDSYCKELEWHRLALDSYAGTGGFAGRIGQPRVSYLGWAADVYSNAFVDQYRTTADATLHGYLDRYPREDEAKYRRRVELAHYQNHVQGIFDLLMGYVLEQAPTYTVPTQVQQWMDDVDWAKRRRMFARRTCLLGWMPVLVDAPAVQFATKAQADRAGLRPMAMGLFPANLLDFSRTTDAEVEAGAEPKPDYEEFDWVKLRIDRCVRPSPLGKKTDLEEYGLWFDDHVERYVVRKTDDKREELEGPTFASHQFGKVPLIVWSCKLGVEDDAAFGMGIIDAAIVEARRLFNLISELDENLRAAVFPMLQVPFLGAEPPAELLIGSGNAVGLPTGVSGEYKWLEPGGASTDAYETRIENTIAEMYRVQNVGRDVNQAQVESGVARAYSFDRTNKLLRSITAQLSEAETGTLKLIAVALGVPGESIKVAPPTEFRVTDLVDDLAALQQAQLAKLPRTALKLMRQRVSEKMLPNLPAAEKATIEQELEDQAKEDEQFQAAERELLLKGGAPNDQNPDENA